MIHMYCIIIKISHKLILVRPEPAKIWPWGFWHAPSSLVTVWEHDSGSLRPVRNTETADNMHQCELHSQNRSKTVYALLGAAPQLSPAHRASKHWNKIGLMKFTSVSQCMSAAESTALRQYCLQSINHTVLRAASIPPSSHSSQPEEFK